MCIGYAYFEHKNLYKYTMVARGQDGLEVRSIIDLVLVKKDMLPYLQDMRAVRGMGGSLSNYQITMLYCVKLGWWGHGLRGSGWRQEY